MYFHLTTPQILPVCNLLTSVHHFDLSHLFNAGEHVVHFVIKQLEKLHGDTQLNDCVEITGRSSTQTRKDTNYDLNPTKDLQISAESIFWLKLDIRENRDVTETVQL